MPGIIAIIWIENQDRRKIEVNPGRAAYLPIPGRAILADAWRRFFSGDLRSILDAGGARISEHGNIADK